MLNYYHFDLSSDDALYFQRALTHFSVLEFSPHFPGYPGFVGLERLIHYLSQHPNSNVLLSFMSAIALTLSIFIYCYRRIKNKAFALFAVMLLLVQGNLAELALNGLSDATALLFFSFYLQLAQFHTAIKIRSTHITISALSSGLLLAVCLATRPSYLPLVTSAILLAYYYHRNNTQLGWQLFSITLIGIICGGYIFSQDGWAYFDEARRFTQGHFTIWGNTSNNTTSLSQQWLAALIRTYSTPGLVLLTLSLLVGLYFQNTRPLSLLAGCWLAWIIRGQNPENIRHLAVFSLLMPLILGLLADRFYYPRQRLANISLYSLMSLFIGVLAYHSIMQFSPQKQAPSIQAKQFFQAMRTEQIIVSNYNIDILRNELPQHIILDRHYKNSSHYQTQQRNYWQLSSTKLIGEQSIRQFNGRVLGERGLYLYYFDTNTAKLD